MKRIYYVNKKSTGINLVQQIPEHWEVKKMKFVAKITTGSKDTENREDDGEYPFFVRSDTVERISTYTFDGEGILTAGDGVGAAKVFHHFSGKFDFHQRVYLIYDFNEQLNGKYLFYYLKEFFSKEVLKSSINTTVDSLRRPMFLNFPLILPPHKEQTLIAKFLSNVCSRIDTLIDQKEKLLKLLEEKRIALITQAVTKGLNPDVRMKPSGVDWLGDIPEHWEVKRLKYFISINPKKSEIYKRDINVSFVPMEAIGEYGGIVLENEKHISEVLNGYTYFRDNDVVVAKITPCFENGKGARAENLFNGIAFGTTELHVLRSSKKVTSQYLEIISYSYPFRKWGEAEMYGAGGQKRVPEEFLKNFLIGIPPIEEQTMIINRINESLNRLGVLKESVITAIDILKEYRTSLITSAVTGKIDVRNYKPEEEHEEIH